MKALQNLLLGQLAQMYQGEQGIASDLSKMAKMASNKELKQALEVHAYETVEHISRVARVFGYFGEPTMGMSSNAIRGLLADAEASVAQHEDPVARDEAILTAAQKLDQYEIGTYGCLRDWARLLHNHEAANLLDEILDEEIASDFKLNDLTQRLLECGGETESAEEAVNCAECGCGRRLHQF